MILARNGKYYFDENQTNELTLELFSQIKGIIFKISDIFKPLKVYQKEICGKIFNFKMIRFMKIYVDEESQVEISIMPIEINFINNNVQETRAIFSLPQYEKSLEYFKIKFPWSKERSLSKESLYNLIYFNIYPIKINVINIDVFNMDLLEENSSINNINKFIDFSKYISFYLKSNININEFEEKKFLDKKYFIVNPNEKFKIYDKENKNIILELLHKNIMDPKKNIFLQVLAQSAKLLHCYYILSIMGLKILEKHILI